MTCFSSFIRIGCCLLLATSLFSCNPSPKSQVAHILMPVDWEFHQVGRNDWMPAKVPGTVHTDLLANEIIADPYYRDHENDLQWIEQEDWEYQTTFKVNAKMMAKDHLELVFKGLDTYAQVFINDSLVMDTDNMFRNWERDVKPYLQEGDNRIRVLFTSPIKAAKPAWEALGYELPGEMRVMTRKAGFHYGWDWGPRFVTSGIWRPVEIRAWDKVRIRNIQLLQEELTDEKAVVKVIYELECSKKNTPVGLKVNVEGMGEVGNASLQLPSGISKQEISFEIQDPQRWWCNGLGEAFLYNIQADLLMEGKVIDQQSSRLGLRTIELMRSPDSLGESFGFLLNDRPVFMKGANYIPQDNFQPRVRREQYDALLDDAVKANMNMLRVWGGGIYEDDIFYELCDEKGLLVWQDFMFACAMYPGDDAFLENVKQEAMDNVIRLRNHPCIALWCGNNENKEGWYRWGWQNPFTQEQRNQLWKDYQAVFEEILPQAVEKYHPGMDYWASSPSYGRGNPLHQFVGDAHYWGVWHDAEPFSVLNEKVPRFMSEFGFQSFPEMRSIMRFAEPEDLDLSSPVMRVHQKHIRGNELIQIYMERDYPQPKDFESFVYLSQVVQAEGIGFGLEAHRRAMPYCMGTLYWQLNDCWPVASWSSRDYEGRWKGLHYAAKRAFAPVMVSSIVEDEDVFRVYGVSDQWEDINDARLMVKVYQFEGKLEQVWQENVRLPANQSRILFEKPLKEIEKGLPNRRSVVEISLEKGEDILAQDHFYFVPAKEQKLPDPGLTWQVTEADDHFIVTLKTKNLARQVCLEIDAEGWFSDNYIDLMPGAEYDVEFYLRDKLPDFSKALKVRSLFDAYE